MASRIPLLRELADYLERTTCVYVPREEIQQIAAGTYPPKKLTYLLKTMKTAGCLGTTHHRAMDVDKTSPAKNYEVLTVKDTNASAFQAFAQGYTIGHYHKPLERTDKLDQMVHMLRSNVAKLVTGDQKLIHLVQKDKNEMYRNQFSGHNAFDIVKYAGVIQTTGWGSHAEFSAMASYGKCEVHIYRYMGTQKSSLLCLVKRFTPQTENKLHMVVRVLERTYQNGRLHYDVLVPPHIHRFGNKFWTGLDSGIFAPHVSANASHKATRLAENIATQNTSSTRSRSFENLPMHENTMNTAGGFNWNGSSRLGSNRK